MKRIIIAGTSVITVIAIGTALASAFSKNTGAYGLNATTASVMPGSARSLYQLEVAALTSQGISEARAVEALNVQNDVWKAGLVHKVEAALGSSYAGMWFDNANAELNIGAVSPAARRMTERVVAQAGLTGHVVETRVRSTWDQLEAALKQWHSRLARLVPHAEAVMGLAAHGNTVAITLGPSVLAADRAAVARDAADANTNVSVSVAPHSLAFKRSSAGSACNAFKTFEAYCEKTLTSGVTIVPSTNPTKANCTAGPMVIPRATKSETYLLTAGHCIGEYGTTTIIKSKWYAFNRSKAGEEIGPAVEFVNATKGDVGLIKINNSSYWVEPGEDPVVANTAEWGTKSPETKYVVTGERAPAEGYMSCHEGQTTGQSCGTIGSTSVTATFPNPPETSEGLVEVTGSEIRDVGGDSGGPWLEILSKSNNEAVMEGTHIGWIIGGGATKHYYEPLSKTYSLFPRNFQLLTKGNENRTKDKEAEEEQENKENKEKEEKEGKELTRLLPEPTGAAPSMLTAKGGEGKFEQVSGNAVSCKTAAGNGTFINANLGYEKTLFEECTSALSTTCTGEGDASGTIEVPGSVHYVLALKMTSSTASTLVPAFAFLVNQIHFTCSLLGIELLVLARGCFAGVEDTLEKLTKNVRLLFEKYTKGENQILSILMENSKMQVKCLLETSFTEEKTGESFELAAYTGEVTFEKWRQSGSEIEVLLMN